MAKRLAGKLAVVTGAANGIGKGCATALLNEGWHVVFTGRREEALKAAIAGAGEAGAPPRSRSAMAITSA